MKLLTFFDGGQRKLGAEMPDGIVDLQTGGFPAAMEAFAQAGPAVWQRASDWLLSSSLPRIDAAKVKIVSPLTHPGKIIGIGLNYADHAAEQGSKIPERPIVFAMFDSSICGPNDTIQWDPNLTNQVDWEAELGVVIGRPARNVREDEALDYVLGYTCVNDVSARDLQFADRQWVRAKSLDTFTPIGPVIVTTDEIPDPTNLAVRCQVNDQMMQDSNTGQMIFNVPYLVSYLSRSFTLLPGDIIATGTPSGVGFARKPPIFLKDGDWVEVEIEKIGKLANGCKEIR